MVRYRNCAVTGCEDEHSHRHRFPNPIKYEKLFKAWVKACCNPKMAERDPEQIYKSYRVCHIHFTPEDISSNMYLKKGMVIPTQNLPDNPSTEPLKSCPSTSLSTTDILGDKFSDSIDAPHIMDSEEVSQQGKVVSSALYLPGTSRRSIKRDNASTVDAGRHSSPIKLGISRNQDLSPKAKKLMRMNENPSTEEVHWPIETIIIHWSQIEF